MRREKILKTYNFWSSKWIKIQNGNSLKSHDHQIQICYAFDEKIKVSVEKMICSKVWHFCGKLTYEINIM